MIEPSQITLLDTPPPAGVDVVALLEALPGPCCIHIPGRDSSRCRFLVTLLHGNEPSGLHAVWQALTEQWQPCCDLYLVIMNVAAARTTPYFTHRQLPNKRDLNRCFKPPYEDAEGQLAAALLELIHTKQPEALLDIHNTSGSGPAFGVAVHLDAKHDALVSLFTERLIVTDLRLGALMELSERQVPTVTIECGGAQDEAAHQIARAGVKRFFETEDLFDLTAAPWPIEVLHNPIRLELDGNLTFTYAEAPQADVALTLRADIERLNFGAVAADTILGWGDAEVLDLLSVRNAGATEPVQDWLRWEAGTIMPARPLKLFMITGRKEIARSDCLLYAVRCAPTQE